MFVSDMPSSHVSMKVIDDADWTPQASRPMR